MSRPGPLAGALTAEAISLLGTRVSMIAIPWFVLSTTGSATQTGLVAAVEITPLVVFKALGGPLLDRVGPRRVTLGCDLASGLVVALIPLLHHLGLLGFPVLLALVALAGALRGPGDAGKAAMTPEIARVAGASLERVTGLAGAVERGSSMVGAAVAGALVAVAGAANALYVDAASFLVSCLVFGLATRGLGRPVPATPPAPGRAATPTSYARELAQGWDFLRREPVLVAICAMVAVTNLIDQGYAAVLAPVWAKESGAGVAVLGSLFAAFSGASALGALVAARWGETLPRFRTYVVAFLVAGAPRYVVLALESPVWLVFAVTMVAGAAAGFLNPILGAVILERIPEPLLGRVSSLNTALCWSLMPLGGLLTGLAVTGLGLSPALLLAGAAYLVATMAPTRVASFRSMERVPAGVSGRSAPPPRPPAREPRPRRR